MRVQTALLLTGFVTIAASAAAEPIIMNGDMNGIVGAGFSPANWMVAQATPDVVDSSGPFNNTGIPWNLSPNGGTFARMNGVGNVQSEGISQNVSGFVAGEMYEISFYATNLGFQVASTGSWQGFDGYFEFYADGSLVATSDTLAKQASGSDPLVWAQQSIEFQASSSDFLLEIRAETTAGTFEIAYMGIDGITAAVIPAPGAFSAFAVLGLAATRRRR